MIDSRRDFIKKAALLAGGAGLAGLLPASIQRAMAINPQAGSTYQDAEHIVILMQENRSFDHCFGTLRGVRGFGDPRAITLPDKNLVWLQTNAGGQTYAPFRLNIQDTKATWMSSLPHSWTNQVDARNSGRHDKWLDAKPSGHPEYARMPLTMGYYNREDIPFYYALADAFTVCDQNFCSSLTGTTPNRLYLWTGTIREQPDRASKARVRNEDVDYDVPASWTTFPERLEDHGISWKIYQNELSLPTGFTGEEEAWLANFTDNPLEWFTQYHVRFSATYQDHLKKQAAALPIEIADLEKKLRALSADEKEAATLDKQLKDKQTRLLKVKQALVSWPPENFDKLPEREKNLHRKAFVTNSQDPAYRQLTTLQYRDGNTERQVPIPKGDVLHQFREDVKSGALPTVSWVVAPENYSDHPGAPWYGAWYVSEMLDILTQNPETWKKTIFIVAYDENDGYFDHVPPFVAPHPDRPLTGRASPGIDTGVEQVSLEQERQRTSEHAQQEARESPIGLGYRVPLLIASPWSRGGYVCSQVFDHTSILQFLETFLSKKFGKSIEEPNISSWRRTVCGDLTSVFRPYQGEKAAALPFPAKEAFLESIHQTQFKPLPSGFQPLTQQQIAQINRAPASSSRMPRQEKGVRLSNALPYQLQVDGQLSNDQKAFQIKFEVGNDVFGKQSAGSPFHVYAPGKYLPLEPGNQATDQEVNPRAYAVAAGSQVTDSWDLHRFEDEQYHLRVHGPNGFYREFKGNADDPSVAIGCHYQRSDKKQLTGNLELTMRNQDQNRSYTIELHEQAYQKRSYSRVLPAAGSKGDQAFIQLDLSRSFGWYDFTIRIKGGHSFEQRYAGRVETGREGYSDPAMG